MLLFFFLPSFLSIAKSPLSSPKLCLQFLYSSSITGWRLLAFHIVYIIPCLSAFYLSVVLLIPLLIIPFALKVLDWIISVKQTVSLSTYPYGSWPMTLPALSAPVCDQKQVSWTCAHPVCRNVCSLILLDWEAMFSLLQDFLQQRWFLSVKTKAKKALTALTLPIVFATRSLMLLIRMPIFSLVFLFLLIYLKKLLLPFTLLARFSFTWVLAFLTPSLCMQTVYTYPRSLGSSNFFIFSYFLYAQCCHAEHPQLQGRNLWVEAGSSSLLFSELILISQFW